jgi:hypothetical protein
MMLHVQIHPEFYCLSGTCWGKPGSHYTLDGERKSLHCHNLGAKIPSSQDVAIQVAKEEDLGRY